MFSGCSPLGSNNPDSNLQCSWGILRYRHKADDAAHSMTAEDADAEEMRTTNFANRCHNQQWMVGNGFTMTSDGRAANVQLPDHPATCSGNTTSAERRSWVSKAPPSSHAQPCTDVPSDWWFNHGWGWWRHCNS